MRISLDKASDYTFLEIREYKSWDDCLLSLFAEFGYGFLIRPGDYYGGKHDFDYYVTIADDYLD